jgi:hypothetical protein
VAARTTAPLAADATFEANADFAANAHANAADANAAKPEAADCALPQPRGQVLRTEDLNPLLAAQRPKGHLK